MKNLTLENIDKSNWKAFPFEKIAIRIAETVDPNKTDLNIYYGLEHLDADSIHIRRNGTPGDVSGGKLKCYPGDVIFGKRRAYQRKAGIVTQAAICSAHSFVFRANEDIMDARLFPFFLHSDQFMHRMIDISVGGLSPTINWSDLKHQEFLLPPTAQQAELAELLWAIDEVIENDLVLSKKLGEYSEIISQNLLGFKPEMENKIYREEKALIDVAPLQRGFDLPDSQLKSGKYPVAYSNGLKNLHSEYKVVGPGVWTGRSGTIGNVFYVEGNYWPHNTTLWVTDFKGNHPKFIFHLYSKLHFEKRVTGTGVPTLNRNDIHKFKVNIPCVDDQIRIAKEIDNLELINSNAIDKYASSKALLKSLINRLF
jgi:type I restriction enzyme S subunit